MSTFEWDDGTGAGRLRGTLHAPGATPGDVLAVNANASVSPAPGGGSQPQRFTITAAEIAARWDMADGVGSVQLPVPAAAVILASIEATPGDLDNGVVFDSCGAFADGADTASAWAGAEGVGTAAYSTWTADTYVSNAPYAGFFYKPAAGGAVYAFYAGASGPPTAGQHKLVFFYA